MTKIVCSDINLFKSSFEAINKTVHEISMEVDSDGIRVNSMDPSHTTFIHLGINEPEFDVYECDKPRKINFSTDDFLKYLKRINKNSKLELIIDDIFLTISGKGNTTKTYKMKLLDIESDIPSFPELEYSMSINMPTKMFGEICNDISEFSQKVKIYNEGNCIYFDSYGSYVDTKLEYNYQNTPGQTYTSIYDIEKIKPILKAEKFAPTTFISYGENMPILIEMKSENENQNLSFLLAPRIEEDI